MGKEENVSIPEYSEKAETTTQTMLPYFDFNNYDRDKFYDITYNNFNRKEEKISKNIKTKKEIKDNLIILPKKEKKQITLRPYQKECVDLINSLDEGSYLINLATGLRKNSNIYVN